MFLFTNYVDDPVNRYNLGFIFIYLIAFNMGVNLLVLIGTILKQIIKGICSYCKKRKHKKAMKQKVKAMEAKAQVGKKKIKPKDFDFVEGDIADLDLGSEQSESVQEQSQPEEVEDAD